MPAPPDWCYVHNFQETHKPRALRLPAGRGCRLRGDMEKLVRELRAAIPAAFESEDYQARAQALLSQFSQRQEAAFNDLQERAKSRNVGLIRTPSGLALAPTSKGEVINPRSFASGPTTCRRRPAPTSRSWRRSSRRSSRRSRSGTASGASSCGA